MNNDIQVKAASDIASEADVEPIRFTENKVITVDGVPFQIKRIQRTRMTIVPLVKTTIAPGVIQVVQELG
jgi:hypothetical protein